MFKIEFLKKLEIQIEVQMHSSGSIDQVTQKKMISEWPLCVITNSCCKLVNGTVCSGPTVDILKMLLGIENSYCYNCMLTNPDIV